MYIFILMHIQFFTNYFIMLQMSI